MKKVALSLDMLMERKLKNDKIDLVQKEVASLGLVNVTKLGNRQLCRLMDNYNITENASNMINNHDMMCELIYKTVPLFKNVDTSILDSHTPYDCVSELLEFSELTELSSVIMEVHGIGDNSNKAVESLSEEIKN